jgi:hypothetical protein
MPPYSVRSSATGLSSTVEIDFSTGTFMNPEGNSFVVSEGALAGTTVYFALEGTVSSTSTPGLWHWEGEDGSQGWFDIRRNEWGFYLSTVPRTPGPAAGTIRAVATPTPPAVRIVPGPATGPTPGVPLPGQEYRNTEADRKRLRKELENND